MGTIQELFDRIERKLNPGRADYKERRKHVEKDKRRRKPNRSLSKIITPNRKSKSKNRPNRGGNTSNQKDNKKRSKFSLEDIYKYDDLSFLQEDYQSIDNYDIDKLLEE
jgi:hypothetical protein